MLYINKYDCNISITFANSVKYEYLISDTGVVFPSLSKENYDFISYCGYVQLIKDSNFPIIPYIGVNGIEIANGINNISLGQLNAKWRFGSSVSNDFYNEICKMLKSDIPVTLSIGPFSSGVYFYKCIETNNGIIPYEYVIDYNEYIESPGKPYIIKPMLVNSHYVTVTGAYRDLQTRKIWLRISSWGEEYYIDYNNYSTQIDIFTNILCVDKG